MSCTDEVPSVEREIEVPAPPGEVWDALPSVLGDDVEIADEPGGPVRVRGPEGEWTGSVEEVDAPNRLAFWWVPVDGDDAPSFVELELTGSAVGTRLRVRETRFDAAVVLDGLLRGPLARARA
jgi:Activator of Hsp90 ATPase homolog 1-like protein